MRTILSQNITAPLTHATSEENYPKILTEGFKTPKIEHPMLWKPTKVMWISMNHDWERWCHAEDFGNVRFTLDVKLKKDLKFAFVKTLNDVRQLTKLLTPEGYVRKECPFYKKFPEYYKEDDGGIDLMDLSHIFTWLMDKKSGSEIYHTFWKKVQDRYDGIYYINSMELHLGTYFNTWDCDSIALFKPNKNMELLNPRLGETKE